jgi:type II secretory pathway component PulC
MKALWFITLLALVFAASPAWGESLADVKLNELGKPVKSGWGKDPFVRVMEREKIPVETDSPPGFRVEGIITGGAKALAIIDGGFYRPGDVIDGFVIEGISSERVNLKKHGKAYTLNIKGFAVTGPLKEGGR